MPEYNPFSFLSLNDQDYGGQTVCNSKVVKCLVRGKTHILH